MHRFGEGDLRGGAVVDLAQVGVVELGRHGGQHVFDRPRALHGGVVPGVAGDGQQVDQALGDRGERPLQVGEARGQAGEHALFETAVDEDRPLGAEGGDQRIGAGAHGRVAARVEELAMFELARGSFDVTGPLERKLLPGPRAGPDGHGRLHGLEVEVEARVGQRRQVGRGRRDVVGPAGARGLPHTPVQRAEGKGVGHGVGHQAQVVVAGREQRGDLLAAVRQQ